MEKIREFLKLEVDNTSQKMLFVYIFIAYFFAIAVRYYWIYVFQNDPNSMWNGQVMINTNDGYAWAEGARDILNGGNTPNDGSAVTQSISKITALLASVVPVSFETLILWMPGVFGSLLVIPVLLIGKAINQIRIGFIAALLASIALSYYNRTMIGYYDTDLLVIVLPTFVLWGVIVSLIEQKNRYLAMTAFLVILYSWYYGGSYSLLMAMSGMLLVYTLFFDRKNLFNYKTVLFILVALNFPGINLKIITVILLFIFFHFFKEKSDKMVIPLLIIIGLYILYIGGFNGIIQKIEQYVIRTAVADDINLKFFSVVQTVREAGAIPFEIFASRISGSIPTFILSFLGTILLIIRYPILLLSLPMVGLGFLAYSSGLRFTVYAVPIFALGIGYLIVLIASKVSLFPARLSFILLATASILYPNIKHVIEYKVPTVFSKNEVSVLNSISKISKEEDYVVTWWDYGFPIRYYSKTKTLVDGGKHSGFQNFAPSLILASQSQNISANLARLEVEYTEKQFSEKWTDYTTVKMMKDYGYENSIEFLSDLTQEIQLPQKTRDIFLYLPNRMFNIFPTVTLFSNLDIMTGERFPQKYFSYTRPVKDDDNQVAFADGSVLSKNNGIISIGGQQIGVKSFHVVQYDRQGKLHKRSQNLRPDGHLNVVFLQSYNKTLILDDAMLNSTFIQLFVFENYNPDLFEPTIMTPYAKVYKLKI